MGASPPLFIIWFEMKNLLIIAGFILIVLNTLIGLMISQYSPFNYLMVDLSLLISTVLIYLFSNSNISDGYKIGLTVLFAITGLAKVVCSLVAPQHSQDNFLIVVVLGLISFEALCLLSAFAMKKFAWRHQRICRHICFFSAHISTLKNQKSQQANAPRHQ